MHSPFRNRLTAAYALSASSKDAMLIFSSIRQPGERDNRYGEKAGEKNKIGTKEIEKILLWAFSLNMINKSIEATLYSKKVGILDQEIVCWQID